MSEIIFEAAINGETRNDRKANASLPGRMVCGSHARIHYRIH